LVTSTLACLGPEYVVIHNLPLAGKGDVDHVVVGPGGVVVLETKYLAGRISYDGAGRWIQQKRHELRQIADPSAQLTQAATAVQMRLANAGFGNVPIYPLLVFAHPHAELELAHSPVGVARPFELVPLLHQLAQEPAQLDDATVAATANTLLGVRGGRRRNRRRWTAPQRGQALVEVACALSVVLTLAFGLLGVARVGGALFGLTAVAREAARAGARAPDASTAVDWANARGTQTASEYSLSGVVLDVDISDFERQLSEELAVPGEIRVRADVIIELDDVPLVSWAQIRVPLRRAFAEVVDPYRSSPPIEGSGR